MQALLMKIQKMNSSLAKHFYQYILDHGLDNALQWLKQQYESQPSISYAQFYIFVLLELQNWEQCVEICIQRLSLKKNEVPTIIALGKAFLGLDQIEEANTIFAKGLELEPQNAELMYLYQSTTDGELHTLSHLMNEIPKVDGNSVNLTLNMRELFNEISHITEKEKNREAETRSTQVDGATTHIDERETETFEFDMPETQILQHLLSTTSADINEFKAETVVLDRPSPPVLSYQKELSSSSQTQDKEFDDDDLVKTAYLIPPMDADQETQSDWSADIEDVVFFNDLKTEHHSLNPKESAQTSSEQEFSEASESGFLSVDLLSYESSADFGQLLSNPPSVIEEDFDEFALSQIEIVSEKLGNKEINQGNPFAKIQKTLISQQKKQSPIEPVKPIVSSPPKAIPPKKPNPFTSTLNAPKNTAPILTPPPKPQVTKQPAVTITPPPFIVNPPKSDLFQPSDPMDLPSITPAMPRVKPNINEAVYQVAPQVTPQVTPQVAPQKTIEQKPVNFVFVPTDQHSQSVPIDAKLYQTQNNKSAFAKNQGFVFTLFFILLFISLMILEKINLSITVQNIEKQMIQFQHSDLYEDIVEHRAYRYRYLYRWIEQKHTQNLIALAELKLHLDQIDHAQIKNLESIKQTRNQYDQIKSSDDSEYIFLSNALIFSKQKKYKEALFLLDQIQFKTSLYYAVKGFILHREYKLQSALDQFMLFLQKHPDSLQIQLKVLEVIYDKDGWHKAESYLLDLNQQKIITASLFNEYYSLFEIYQSDLNTLKLDTLATDIFEKKDKIHTGFKGLVLLDIIKIFMDRNQYTKVDFWLKRANTLLSDHPKLLALSFQLELSQLKLKTAQELANQLKQFQINQADEMLKMLQGDIMRLSGVHTNLFMPNFEKLFVDQTMVLNDVQKGNYEQSFDFFEKKRYSAKNNLEEALFLNGLCQSYFKGNMFNQARKTCLDLKNLVPNHRFAILALKSL